METKTYNSLADFVKERRRLFGLTQVDTAAKAGVGLRFVRELEQGKTTLQLDKVNQVLMLFGHQVGAVPIDQPLRQQTPAADANTKTQKR